MARGKKRIVEEDKKKQERINNCRVAARLPPTYLQSLFSPSSPNIIFLMLLSALASNLVNILPFLGTNLSLENARKNRVGKRDTEDSKVKLVPMEYFGAK